eukprot:TRINITY_DN3987_c0_g1_i1.p1 TRINITY_DN3987_c0_g1~~TRINITY_DN3987_c0_g1_i1.p1  ORF type:complete len:326 (-),score=48.51 TRINITY_DN3987_c0_g1_i1:636-1613(-)
MAAARKAVSERQILPWLSDTVLGFLIAGAGQLVGTFDATFVRMASPEVTSDSLVRGWQLIFWRFTFTSIFLLVLVIVTGTGDTMAAFLKAFDGIGVAAAVSISACQLAYTWALQLMPAANAIVVFASCPILTAVATTLVFREPPSTRIVIVAAMGFLSIFVVFAGEVKAASMWAFGLAFLSAVAMASYSCCCYAASQKDASRNMIPSLVCGGVLSALVAGVAVGDNVEVSTHELAWLCAQGMVVPLWIAALTVSARYITPVEVNMVLLLDPLLAPVWVWLAGFEPPPRYAMVGAVGLACCLLLHGRWSASKKETKESLEESLLGA